MISSPLILSQQSCDVETLVKPYSDQLSSLIDKDAPLRTKSIVLRPSCTKTNATIMVLLDLSAAFDTIDQTNSSSSPRTSLWGNRKTPNMDGIIPQ